MTKRNFDYTNALKEICVDICAKIPEFRHIDPYRIGYSFSIAKNVRSRYGVWASIVPLRFENGSRVAVRERRVSEVDITGKRKIVVYRSFYKYPRIVDKSGAELLYLFQVMAPRFLDLSITEKIETIMHELYHISPSFNGDARRFPGRNWQHGNKAEYAARSSAIAARWLKTEPDPRVYDFLRYSYRELCQQYDGVVGVKYSFRAIPISETEALRLGFNALNE